jgi:hypothetical protein
MFKNHKLELKLVKNRNQDELVDATPSVTKEDIVHIAKNVAKFVIGGVLITMAAGAALDTAQYAAMTRIDKKNSRELEN